jgi:glycosyltransferase 2 family protein
MLTGVPIRIAVSLLVGVALLALAAMRVSFEDIRGVIALIEWRWVLLAMLSYAAALFWRSVRWWTILNATVGMRLRHVAMALLVGYAVNVVLPARLGELFRADFCRREYGVSRSVALGAILVERLTDGLLVVGALFVGLLTLHTPGSTKETLDLLLIAAALLFGSCMFALYILGSDWTPRLFAKVPRFSGRLNAFHSSIRLVRSARMFLILLESFIVWCFEGGALSSTLAACGVSLDVFGVCLLIGVVSLATLLPSPPGFMGTMQFAFVLPGTLYGYSASQGIVAATANQLFLLLPMAATGAALLSWRYLAHTLARRRAPAQADNPEPDG